MNSRPKRACRQTIDYKAIHEGKQNQPKRSKENLRWKNITMSIKSPKQEIDKHYSMSHVWNLVG